jgi:hypothetical protein
VTNWQTILSGIATALTGAGIIYFAAVMIPPDALDSTVRGTIIFIGVGFLTAGSGIAASRANATSVAAHQESLDKIAEERTHQAGERQAAIQHIDRKFEAVKDEAAGAAVKVAEIQAEQVVSRKVDEVKAEVAKVAEAVAKETMETHVIPVAKEVAEQTVKEELRK